MAGDGLVGAQRIERAAQHDLVRTLEEVGQGVEAAAMRERRDVQLRVRLVERVDVGVVSVAHEHEVAVRKHRALGTPGGAAGEEDPRRIGGLHRARPRGRFAEEALVAVGAGADHPLQPGHLALERREPLRERGCGEEQLRARALGDVSHLLGMELGVGGHEAKTRGPAGEVQFQDFRAVLHANCDAISRGERGRKRSGDPRHAVCERGEGESD